EATVYIVTESIFSMDGDAPNLEQLTALAERFSAYVVIDEAHAVGVFGDRGEGLVQQLQLQDKIFARIVTFGKGLGCHGAAILGSEELRNYLINFSRSFIYTTALSPHSVATIISSYRQLIASSIEINQLWDNILHFNQQKIGVGLKQIFVRSKSAIQSAVIPGNEKVKNIAANIQQQGFDVKAILSPTVPQGQERLRFCLHSYNTQQQISEVLQVLAASIF
ncbi:MAG TPA: aminotransferase class I/II-fold pyridoxal phosphate-dependent enzyme, partial [Flavobacterium sp.]|nr:aminotransferase class I/II-fold pyridoxal phosphate-dependent enzyme [Flavobacterium sp.]